MSKKPEILQAAELVAASICRERPEESLADSVGAIASALAPGDVSSSVASSLDKIATAIEHLATAIEGLKK